MRLILVILATLAAVGLASGAGSASLAEANLQTSLMRRYNLDAIVDMLEKQGFEPDVANDEVTLTFEHGDWQVAILLYDDDLQRVEDAEDATVFMLQASQDKLDIKVSKVNDWNRGNYFSRLYLNNDDDKLYLEYDVELSGGVHPENIKRVLERFETAMDDAELFLWPR